MALETQFYSEIFEKEQKWIESINSNLLNSVYCNLTLKPFYLEKKKELEKEYKETNNILMKQIISIINNIIDEIELFYYQYTNYQSPNINLLLPLFLTTQMNNMTQKEDSFVNKENEEINKIQIRNQVLENQVENSGMTSYDDEDYVYDDFSERRSRVK